MFKCPICGKEYDTATEMGKCAISCEEKNNKAIEKAAAEKRIKAMNTAKEAIDNCYQGLRAMVAQFNKDYPETQISVSMITETKKKENKTYRLPNEWDVPLNFNTFDSIIDAFIKGDK